MATPLMPTGAVTVRAVALAIVLAASTSRADVLNHELLRKHVDQLAEHGAVDEAPRVSLVLPTLIPGIGTYRVEKRVFGGLRPAGVVFDWGLGGAVPVTFGAIALGSSGRTRDVCAWTAIGAYAVTRLAILVIANLHISEYNRRVRMHRR
jgi:hypothetical protein